MLRNALAAGAASQDFFGFAYGRDGDRYLGLQFGHATSPIFDDSLLLLEPEHAAEAVRKQAPPPTPVALPVHTSGDGVQPPGFNQPAAPVYTTGVVKPAPKRRFFGTVDLDPVRAKLQFSDVVDEVIALFAQRPDTRIRVVIEIEAESETGFDDNMQRAVRENCTQLKFKGGSGFEE